MWFLGDVNHRAHDFGCGLIVMKNNCIWNPPDIAPYEIRVHIGYQSRHQSCRGVSGPSRTRFCRPSTPRPGPSLHSHAPYRYNVPVLILSKTSRNLSHACLARDLFRSAMKFFPQVSKVSVGPHVKSGTRWSSPKCSSSSSRSWAMFPRTCSPGNTAGVGTPPRRLGASPRRESKTQSARPNWQKYVRWQS